MRNKSYKLLLITAAFSSFIIASTNPHQFTVTAGQPASINSAAPDLAARYEAYYHPIIAPASPDSAAAAHDLAAVKQVGQAACNPGSAAAAHDLAAVICEGHIPYCSADHHLIIAEAAHDLAAAIYEEQRPYPDRRLIIAKAVHALAAAVHVGQSPYNHAAAAVHVGLLPYNPAAAAVHVGLPPYNPAAAAVHVGLPPYNPAAAAVHVWQSPYNPVATDLIFTKGQCGFYSPIQTHGTADYSKGNLFNYLGELGMKCIPYNLDNHYLEENGSFMQRSYGFPAQDCNSHFFFLGQLPFRLPGRILKRMIEKIIGEDIIISVSSKKQGEYKTISANATIVEVKASNTLKLKGLDLLVYWDLFGVWVANPGTKRLKLDVPKGLASGPMTVNMFSSKTSQQRNTTEASQHAPLAEGRSLLTSKRRERDGSIA